MFGDRQEAGWLLAEKLKDSISGEIVVLGLTRGGAVVAHEVAKALGVLWDVLVVKKIGAPENEELAIGAAGPDKVVVWDERLCQALEVNKEYKKKILATKSAEREEKERFFRQGRQPLALAGKTVILVDDGIATGSTTQAAVEWIRQQKPQKIILAIPVAPPEAVEKLKPLVDELICLCIEPDFWAVGQFYEEFGQVSDEEVLEILKEKVYI